MRQKQMILLLFYYYNLILNNSNDVFLVDKISTLEIDGKRIIGNLDGKNIEGMMYGNLYGKQTKR